jgi:hypothetical protein
MFVDERYELHRRLQEATSRSGVAFHDFRAMHHIAYTTFYKFLKDPEKARPRTLVSVRLACEFLDAACQAGLLPIPRHKVKEKAEIVDRLYSKWWNNGKKFNDEDKAQGTQLELI